MGLRKLSWLVLVLMFVFCFSACESSDDDDSDGFNDPIEITITALLATTGNSSSFGESEWAAVQLAEDDINEWFRGQTGNWWVQCNLVNTTGSPETALGALESLTVYNGSIVIGPTTSSEAAYIREYATANDILLVSPSSVAISAAIADDNLYRFVTDDSYQAKAMNAMLVDDEIDVLIPLTRDDVWGNDLLAATTAEFEAAGGTVIEGIKYDPSTDDFTTILENFTDLVDETIAPFPNLNYAIYGLTFGEITSIFEGINDNETLLALPWYGSSAAAKNASLVTSEVAAEVAAEVGFPCSVYGDHNSAEFTALKTRLETELGREPESYAFAAYDATWVAVKSYFELSDNNPEFAGLKTKFEEICETYEGVTGPLTLNDAGDRVFGNYDFWAIQANGDDFEWYLAARYEINPETFEGTLVRY